MARKKKGLMHLEDAFEDKIHEVSQWVAKEVGRPAHEISSDIHKVLDDYLPHMSEIHQLKFKEHLTRMGTPAIGVFLAYSYTGGHPNPTIILPLALGGAVIGFWEAHEMTKKIKALERKEFEKRHRIKLRKVTP